MSLPRPHAAQCDVISAARRFNAVDCGRRWGKTILGMDRVIRQPLEGKPAGWFAPSYKYLLEPWAAVRDVLAPVTKRVSEQEKRLELVTGGLIEFWSMEDPDAGRSRKYAEVVIDEAAMVRDLESRWHKAIRPTLADYRGSAWLLSTPKGMNFFWQAFTLGQDRQNDEWASWQMPTSTNPFIDDDEIEAARLGMPERSFAQEFLAEFIEEAGGVFRGVRAAIDEGRKSPEYPEGCSIGVDLARVEDFTVIDAMSPQGRQVYHERFNQISWERQIARIADVYSRFPNATIYIDSTGVGDPIFERLKSMGLRVEAYGFTNASKEALIDNLAMQIERQAVRLMDIPEQTSEMFAYQYELTPSRNVRMNAPAGMHDDCVIALALSAWPLRFRTVGWAQDPNALDKLKTGWAGQAKAS